MPVVEVLLAAQFFPLPEFTCIKINRLNSSISTRQHPCTEDTYRKLISVAVVLLIWVTSTARYLNRDTFFPGL